jgi:hypothetical protein
VDVGEQDLELRPWKCHREAVNVSGTPDQLQTVQLSPAMGANRLGVGLRVQGGRE